MERKKTIREEEESSHLGERKENTMNLSKNRKKRKEEDKWESRRQKTSGKAGRNERTHPCQLRACPAEANGHISLNR